MVVRLNAALCQHQNVLHKPTSDGYEPARSLWESCRGQESGLERALLVAYECHCLAPFCFFNGNTFVAVVRQMIEPILAQVAPNDPDLAAQFRSVIGHFVAGTEGIEEMRDAIRSMQQRLDGS
ncbi:MAG: hypothetical protein U1A53_01495 [Prosthecobacter sp.]|nr:hypothetical protein [Prosthecobacter sp.]